MIGWADAQAVALVSYKFGIVFSYQGVAVTLLIVAVLNAPSEWLVTAKPI